MADHTLTPADVIRDHDEVTRTLTRLRDARDTCTDPAGTTTVVLPGGQKVRVFDLAAEDQAEAARERH